MAEKLNHSEISMSLENSIVNATNASDSMFSEESYELVRNVSELISDFGPRRDPLYIVIPITVIYASIFLSGIVGNVSTCIVIARNKSMHTATNYYLFSLAISDLLLLVSGLPAEIYLVWSKYPYVFGEIFCILRGLAAETSTNATVLTITAFTVERYVAICHPFLSHTMSKLSRAVKLILVVWLVALSFAVPQALQFGIVEAPDRNSDLVMCTLKTIIIAHSFELCTFLFFVVPMTLITVLYALIGLKLRKSNMMKRGTKETVGQKKNGTIVPRDRSCRHHPGRSSRRVLKMLVAVVVAFFICWAPFHVQRLIAIYGTNSTDHVTSNSPWMEFLYLFFTYFSGVLYYVSTTINPILYNIMSNKFREAFLETLERCCGFSGIKGRHGQRRSYSTLSRSQQRTHGLFCGNGGTGTAQESTDCSGNSVRDESMQQSISGTGTGTGGYCVGGDNILSRNPSCESGYQGGVSSVPYGKAGGHGGSRRTLSTDIGSSENNLSESYSSNGRSVRNYCRRWPSATSGSWCAVTPGSTRIEGFYGNGESRSVPFDAKRNVERRIEAHREETSRGRIKPKWTPIVYRPKRAARYKRRWWRLFEWLSSRKRPTVPRMSYSSPGPGEKRTNDEEDEDMEKNRREEYSMTSCHVSNTSLKDVDRCAMDEELSHYMEEIRRRDRANELRNSENG